MEMSSGQKRMLIISEGDAHLTSLKNIHFQCQPVAVYRREQSLSIHNNIHNDNNIIYIV